MIEATLEEILSSYDWEEVFGEGSGGNCTQDVESPDGTATGTVLRSDIAEVLGSVNGENDAYSWACLVRLNDGRFCAASGSCDYTGWDCRAGNRITVARDAETVIRFGLDDSERRRMGCQIYA